MPIAYSQAQRNAAASRKSPKTCACRLRTRSHFLRLMEMVISIITELAPDTARFGVWQRPRQAYFLKPTFPAWFANQGHECDGLFIVGCTTSGCVRASAVDAFSRQINSFIIADAVFDRFSASHKIALFDCQAKYADLISAADFETHSAAKSWPTTKRQSRAGQKAPHDRGYIEAGSRKHATTNSRLPMLAKERIAPALFALITHVQPAQRQKHLARCRKTSSGQHTSTIHKQHHDLSADRRVMLHFPVAEIRPQPMAELLRKWDWCRAPEKSNTHSTAVIAATRNGSIRGISGRALLQMARPSR